MDLLLNAYCQDDKKKFFPKTLKCRATSSRHTSSFQAIRYFMLHDKTGVRQRLFQLRTEAKVFDRILKTNFLLRKETIEKLTTQTNFSVEPLQNSDGVSPIGLWRLTNVILDARTNQTVTVLTEVGQMDSSNSYDLRNKTKNSREKILISVNSVVLQSAALKAFCENIIRLFVTLSPRIGVIRPNILTT